MIADLQSVMDRNMRSTRMFYEYDKYSVKSDSQIQLRVEGQSYKNETSTSTIVFIYSNDKKVKTFDLFSFKVGDLTAMNKFVQSNYSYIESLKQNKIYEYSQNIRKLPTTE